MKKPTLRFKLLIMFLPVIAYVTYDLAGSGLLKNAVKDAFWSIALPFLAAMILSVYCLDKKHGLRYPGLGNIKPRRTAKSFVALSTKLLGLFAYFLAAITLVQALFVGLFALNGLYPWWGPAKLFFDFLWLWAIYKASFAIFGLHRYQ